MKTLKIDKTLKNATEMLTVINSCTLKEGADDSERDANIAIWRQINNAIKSITEARVIINEQLKKQK
jgi:hypothetical protein